MLSGRPVLTAAQILCLALPWSFSCRCFGRLAVVEVRSSAWRGLDWHFAGAQLSSHSSLARVFPAFLFTVRHDCRDRWQVARP
eukprot:3005440-Pyramimonas_sp.AAC.1